MEANLPTISHPELAANLQAQQAPPAPETPTESKRWAGKYTSPEELERGYEESQREVTQNLLPRIQQAEQRAAALEAAILTHGQPVAPSKTAFERIAELGIPAEDLRGAIMEAFEPLQRAISAQTELMGEIPDFPKVAPDIQKFVSSHPSLQREFNEINAVSPKAAAKYAYREFQAATAPTQRTTAAPSTASQPPATVGPRTAPGEVDWNARLQAELEHMQNTGEDRDFVKTYWNAVKARRGIANINPYGDGNV